KPMTLAYMLTLRPLTSFTAMAPTRWLSELPRVTLPWLLLMAPVTLSSAWLPLLAISFTLMLAAEQPSQPPLAEFLARSVMAAAWKCGFAPLRVMLMPLPDEVEVLPLWLVRVPVFTTSEPAFEESLMLKSIWRWESTLPTLTVVPVEAPPPW